MSTDTIEKIDNKQITDDGEHDKFSHYVKKENILASQIDGKPAIALCGKKWFPNSDPEKYPVCPDCEYVYENIVGTGPGAK